MKRFLAAVAALLMTLTLGTAPVRAQTLPPLPAPVSQLLAVVSPTVSPVCGDATLVVVLLPALVALPVPIPPQVQDALSPVAIVCGAIPAPDGSFTCGLDAQAQALVDSITYQAAGTSSPVAIVPGAIATEQVVTLENTLGPDVKELELGKTVAGTFQCTPTAVQAAPHPKPTTPAGPTVTTVPPVTGVNTAPAVAPVDSSSSETATPLAPLAPTTPDTTNPPTASPPPTTSAGAAPAPTALATRPAGTTRAGMPIGRVLILIVLIALLGSGLAVAVTRPILTRSMKELP